MPTSKERIAYRKAHGLCIWCGEPIPEGCRSSRYCKKHYEQTLRNHKKRKDRPADEKACAGNGGKKCVYYAQSVAEVCLNCKYKRCMDPDRGCAEYREALKNEPKLGGSTWITE